MVPHGVCWSQSCFPQRPSTGRWVGGRCNSPEIRCEAHLEAAQWSQGRLGEGGWRSRKVDSETLPHTGSASFSMPMIPHPHKTSNLKHTPLLSHSSSGSRVQTQPNWALCLGPRRLQARSSHLVV